MSTAVEGSGLQPTAEREAQLRVALEDVKRRIETALAGRASRKPARLVAVSKTKPASDIMAAYNCGQRHFGENYVNELVEKSKLLPGDIQWHYIGALQTNKSKLLAAIPNLFVVETVDGTKKADALNNACDANQRTMNVFIQVNTSGEESKNGINPSDVVTLAKHIVENCPRLNLQGLMTIGAMDRPGNGLNPDFQALENCKTAVHRDLGLDVELSMGMSSDFEQALNQGSTNVRIGSTIFGERDYSKR